MISRIRATSRRLLVRQLHQHGIYRLGARPFGAIDRELRLREFGVTLVFDIGANVGGWAQQLREQGYDGRIVSVEPASESFESLARRADDDPAWDVHHAAAGDHDHRAAFNIASNATSSSLLGVTTRFSEEHPNVLVSGQEEVDVWRLDRFVSELGADDHVWVKLDVEGNELAAVAGAQELLRRSQVVEVELATERLYADEPLFYEVAPALYDLGFVLIAVASAYTGPSGRTMRFDGLFARLREPS